MRLLEERIKKDGRVRPGNILKVDGFLNHQMDMSLYTAIGREFHRLFASEGVTKILTIEASGIGLACFTALEFGVLALFAKKIKTKNIDADVYRSTVLSYTHGVPYDIMVSKEFLTAADRVLIIDDFLANGKALAGLIDIVTQSGAMLVGCGIAVEKGFQEGGRLLRASGVRIESLAIVESMDDAGNISFRES